MQLTGALINDLLVFIGFLCLSLLINGKIRLGKESQNKLDAIINRNRLLLKISANGGTVVFAVIILITLFSPPRFKSGKLREPVQVSPGWTKADKDVLTASCVRGTVQSFQKDSNRTKVFCACITERYTVLYTKEQLDELHKKTRQEQIDFFQPFIKGCVKEIDSTNKQEPIL